MDRPALRRRFDRRWVFLLALFLFCGQSGAQPIQQEATLTEWNIPLGPRAGPRDLTLISARWVYFNQTGAEGKLGELDMVKNIVRLWSTPDGLLAGGHAPVRFGDS